MYNPIYLTAIRGKTTHQYFDQRVWQNGSLILSGALYSNVKMLFDLELEQLVIKHPDPSRWDGISINMDSLSGFTLAKHHFKKLPFKNSHGFYDMLFQGKKLVLVAKRKKKNTPQKGGVELVETTEYFSVKDNQLIPLRGMGTMIKLYPEYKGVIQDIKKTEKLKVQLRKEAKTIKFMESLDHKMKTDK